MPIDYNEDEARRAEQDVERDMKIFSDLKSITLPDGSQVKIVAMSDAVESHIRKFHLKKAASFIRSDARVVEKARNLARRRDNSLLVVRTDDGFDLYDMKEESEIQPRTPVGSSSGYVPSARQDRGCLIAIGIIVAIIVISYIIIVINKQSRMSSQSGPVPQQGQLVGTMRAVKPINLICVVVRARRTLWLESSPAMNES